MCDKRLGSRFHAIMATALWLFNLVYIATRGRLLLNFIMFAIAQLVLKFVSIFALTDDSILVTSASLVIILCMNRWGESTFEILALSTASEIVVWVTIFYIGVLKK